MAKPNKENIITDILKELANNTTFTECFKVILSKFKLSEPTFATYWKEANLRHIDTVNEAQNAIKVESIAMTIEGAKQGLKSRLEYCLEIQKMLDEDTTTETIWDFKNNEPITYTRQLTPLERKALYERISKFEGMDAPTQQEVTVKKIGKDLADEIYE